jgi:hypothetical protein
MALVFEEFVRNFYRLEQQQYHVSRGSDPMGPKYRTIARRVQFVADE